MTGSAVTLPPSTTPTGVSLPGASAVQLVGERIFVRELVEDDAAACVDAAIASRRLHGRWVQPPVSIDDFLARMERRKAVSNSVSLLARRSDVRSVVGIFNLSEIIRGPLQQAFLGYYAFEPNAGAGYMREATALVLVHAFRTLKLHRIEANIQPENTRSIALVDACGFVREGFSRRYLRIAGRWRDHERWAINTERWLEHRRSSRK